MKLEDLKKQLLEDKEIRKAYEKRDLAFEVGQMILEARIHKGLTQEELAKKISTKQSSIARLEGGSTLPSLSFLDRIAKALDTYLVPPKFTSESNTEAAFVHDKPSAKNRYRA